MAGAGGPGILRPTARDTAGLLAERSFQQKDHDHGFSPESRCQGCNLRLRVVALGSNIAFLVYGYALGLTPIWVLHGMNGWRLIEALRSRPSPARMTAEGAGRDATSPVLGATASGAAYRAGASQEPAGSGDPEGYPNAGGPRPEGSPQHLAAVDDQCLPGHPGRRAAAQKHGYVGDLLGMAEAAPGYRA